MPETTQIKYSYKELAEIMVKQSDLHEGIWGIYLEFGLGAANMQRPGADSTNIIPTAILPVIAIGLQKFDKENDLTVDASKVNPMKC